MTKILTADLINIRLINYRTSKFFYWEVHAYKHVRFDSKQNRLAKKTDNISIAFVINLRV